MARYVEECVKHCSRCRRSTRHHRTNTRSSGFMIMIHVLLTLFTAGLWLVPVILVKVLACQIGGWRCTQH